MDLISVFLCSLVLLFSPFFVNVLFDYPQSTMLATHQCFECRPTLLTSYRIVSYRDS